MNFQAIIKFADDWIWNADRDTFCINDHLCKYPDMQKNGHSSV